MDGQNVPVVLPGAPAPTLLPTGWQVESSEPLTVAGPEKDVRMTFCVLPRGGAIKELVAAAWQRISPGFALPLFSEVQTPPSEGWAGTYEAVYQGAASNPALGLAVAKTLADQAYLTLVQGTRAGLGRRMAQVAEIQKGWKPVGLKAPSLAGKKARMIGDEERRELDRFVKSAMARLGIPGVSIAIVQAGETAYAQGFGTGQVGTGGAVTPTTRFLIGSASKALTTLMMAGLVDQGFFTWETPVNNVLPSFALADANLTDQLQMRHTVSASTGMPRRDLDLIFRFRNVRAEDRIAEMKKMRPTTALGETFQYSNYLVAAGGYAAAHSYNPAVGLAEAYQHAMADLVFRPLRMNATTVACPEGARASPHGRRMDGSVAAIEPGLEQFVDAVAPAGSIWSTVLDLAEYLKCELNDGRNSMGERVVSRANLLTRRQRGITIDGESSYGLGLVVSSAQGLTVVSHGGNTLGFTSDLFFLPEHGLGVAVLTNLRISNAFLEALRQKLFEVLFKAEPTSEAMIAAALDALDRNNGKLASTVQTGPEASRWIGTLMGDYDSDELGPAHISREPEGTYRIGFDAWSSALGTAGPKELVLVSAPWRANLRLQLAEEAEALVLDEGQTQYRFIKRLGRACDQSRPV